MAKLWLTAEDTIEPTGIYTEEAIHTASFVLYKLTGEKYPGISTSTDVISSSQISDIRTKPALIGGRMHNIPSNSYAGQRELDLRQKPVHAVHQVEINGIIMDPSEYSLRNNAYIVRRAPNLWMLGPMDELTVTYTHGARPPRAGKAAAQRLANEIILWYNADPACALPERITSVARQGVSYTIVTPQDFLEMGKTGINAVDTFIAAVNPDRQRKKPAIFRPGTRTERIN